LGSGSRVGDFEENFDAGGIEPVVPGDLIQLGS